MYATLGGIASLCFQKSELGNSLSIDPINNNNNNINPSCSSVEVRECEVSKRPARDRSADFKLYILIVVDLFHEFVLTAIAFHRECLS